ncbi:hypothetical protein D6C77_00598 [Aureobasidium pullulans]|nr:hypothetical protein D6C77_00598 [Aureobasidium pullulans]
MERRSDRQRTVWIVQPNTVTRSPCLNIRGFRQWAGGTTESATPSSTEQKPYEQHSKGTDSTTPAQECYQHNFVEHGFSPHSPQTGYRAEDDLSGQSFYRQTHEQSQIAPISEMSSIDAQVPTWQAPRHSVPTSLGSDTPLACWVGSSTYNHDVTPTYVTRLSGTPTISSTNIHLSIVALIQKKELDGTVYHHAIQQAISTQV